MFDIFLSTLGSSSIVLCILFVCKKWFVTRLTQGIEHEYKEKIEIVKNELESKRIMDLEIIKYEMAKESSIISFAYKSVGESITVVQQKKIEAINELWEKLLILRNSSPAMMGIFDILSPDEYVNINQGKFADLENLFDHEKYQEGIIQSMQSVERLRPFVGYLMWSLFVLYCSVHVRIIYKYWMEKEKHQVEPWYKDKSTVDLLYSALNEDEKQEFDGLKFQRIQWFRERIQEKILREIEFVLSGNVVGESATQQATRISNALLRNKGIQDFIGKI